MGMLYMARKGDRDGLNGQDQYAVEPAVGDPHSGTERRPEAHERASVLERPLPPVPNALCSRKLLSESKAILAFALLPAPNNSLGGGTIPLLAHFSPRS